MQPIRLSKMDNRASGPDLSELDDICTLWVAAGHDRLIIGEIGPGICHVFPADGGVPGTTPVMEVRLGSAKPEEIRLLLETVKRDLGELWVTTSGSGSGMCTRE